MFFGRSVDVCKPLVGNRKLVQVVDDDLAVCDSLKFALELEGLEVRTHVSGASLFADALLPAADCLILDYRMPSMDGFAVMAELARQSIKTPVIIITAPVSDALRCRAKRCGAFALLEKPLLDDVLLNNVRAAIPA